MNSLSWLIYLADIAGGITRLVCAVGFVVGTWGLISYVGYFACRADRATDDPTGTYYKRNTEWMAIWSRYSKFVPIGFAMAVFGVLLPSPNAVYAIAASQMGERVLASQAVQPVLDDATRALQAWIKRQIGDEKKP